MTQTTYLVTEDEHVSVGIRNATDDIAKADVFIEVSIVGHTACHAYHQYVSDVTKCTCKNYPDIMHMYVQHHPRGCKKMQSTVFSRHFCLDNEMNLIIYISYRPV